MRREKLCAEPLRWSYPKTAQGQRGLRARVPLTDVHGNPLQGAFVEASCNLASIQLPVTILLLGTYKMKPRAVARLDYYSRGHPNTHRLCEELHLVNAGPHHFHDTELHARATVKELFEEHVDLPVARPIQEPSNWREIVETAADLLHIEDLTHLSEPEWQPPTAFL